MQLTITIWHACLLWIAIALHGENQSKMWKLSINCAVRICRLGAISLQQTITVWQSNFSIISNNMTGIDNRVDSVYYLLQNCVIDICRWCCRIERQMLHKSSCYPILLQISRGRCTLRNAELRKGVFCGTKIAENIVVVELRLVLELGLVIAAYSVLLAIKF